MNRELSETIERWRARAGGVGIVGIMACLAGGFFAHQEAFQACWMAWIFWAGLSFGSLIILLLNAVVGGAWGVTIRPIVLAAARTLPLAGLLLVPLLFGLADIFPWMHAEIFEGKTWRHKQAYLTPLWFIVRTVVYLGIIGAITVFLGLWRSSGETPRRDMSGIGAGGLVAYFLVMIFASTDWVLSLEPQWSSTMFVVIVMAGQFLSALSLAILLVALLADETRRPVKALHDLGNLLLAFVVFWAYVTFSQFLIIWSGNLPREISWYLHRSAGVWPWVVIALAVFQFAVPFALLLLRITKRQREFLGPIAGLVFVSNIVHVCWLVAPSFPPSGWRLPLLGVAAFTGLGGLWMFVFLSFLSGRHWLPPLSSEREVARA